MKDEIRGIFDELYIQYPCLKGCAADIERSYCALEKAFGNGAKLLVCGNGGSAADSEHITGELMKGFNLKRKLGDEQRALFNNMENGAYLADNLQGALPVISLVSQTGLMTAFINDVKADMVFAQQVYGYLKPGDVLLALSTSGNSANVYNAACVAASLGGTVIAVTGEKGGKLNDVSRITVKLPALSPYRVQELTLPLYHALCAALELSFFKD